MKKILFVFSFLCVSYLSQAQNNSQDLIILDNGSTFIGEVIEYVAESHILIQTSMPKAIRLPMTSVKKIVQDYLSIQGLHESLEYKRTYFHFDIGTPITPDPSFGLEAGFSVIKQINQFVGVGAGMSYVKYTFNEYSDERTERIPIYLSFRSYLKDGKDISPFIQINAGYAFNIHDDAYKSGVFANPKLGLRFGSDGLMYNFYAGVHLLKSDTDLIETPWGSSYEQIRTLRRLTLGVGIMF